MIPSTLQTDYKTFILVGLGREGLSSYHFFAPIFPEAAWIFSDDLPLSALDANWKEELQQKNHSFVPLSDLESSSALVNPLETLLIKTAGIPIEKAGIQACVSAGVKLTSNTAIFFEVISALPVSPKTIGITGTKGKSTTSSMIFHVLKENNVPVVLAGNIGVPPLETLKDPIVCDASVAMPPAVVLELSSHQLRELRVSPHIAVVQDITPEHLDYYDSFSAYMEAKAPLVTHQLDQDWLLFNPAYQVPTQLAERSPAQKIHFSLDRNVRTDGTSTTATVYLAEDWLQYEGQQVILAADIPLVGKHNLLNTMPAIAIAMKLFDLPAKAVAKAIRSFVGLPHRLESAGEIKGVRYYNDSQATAPEATIAALSSFPGKRIVLIAGGSDKGVSFEMLGQEIVKRGVSDLLVFPPMGEKIVEAVRAAAKAEPGLEIPRIQAVQSMSEAVQAAAAKAEPGAIVLLSPSCASFGLFKNYQDRGNQFKAAVAALK
ncbi:UDP-N-acetylmuramoyl-L-alanine--D-glutamate ligase [Candidatus Woesebacteria bacterium]|nr:UDP-N-acetylmuramoyl-L-alanine--D-glutamate ligase [Candidatus Woesebacteria bacterium]